MTECRKLRRMLVRYGVLDAASGMLRESAEKWETRPCGTPLFTTKERESGLCQSCADGWSDAKNQPIEEPSAANLNAVAAEKEIAWATRVKKVRIVVGHDLRAVAIEAESGRVITWGKFSDGGKLRDRLELMGYEVEE